MGTLNQNQNIDTAFKSEKRAELKEKFVYNTGCFYALTKWLFVAVIFLALIHFFIATIFIVDGASMEPNFHTGELILVNRFQYLFGDPQRGDVAVMKFPGDPDHKKYIKRIIGLPGDTVLISEGKVHLNGKILSEKYLPDGLETEPNLSRTMQAGEYFLMGDNRPNSSDSRIWGVADKRFLIGKGFLILWPINSVGSTPKYTF